MEMEELESYVPPLSEGEVESDDEDGDVSEDSEDEGGESDTLTQEMPTYIFYRYIYFI